MTQEENKEWTSVKDSLPINIKWVVALYHNELPFKEDLPIIARYDGIGWLRFYGGKELDYVEGITHWLPIPEFPKDNG